MRKYNKSYPSKSLKVNVRIVRSALKPAGEESKGELSYMQSVKSVLGDDVSDDAALDAWLAMHNGDGDGLFVLGDTTGDGDLSFVVTEASTKPAAEKETEALESSGSSTHSATAAEQEILRLKASLEVAELRNKELSALRSAPSPATLAPPTPLALVPPPATPMASVKPNPSLDRPTSLTFNCTPKDLFARWEQSTPRSSAPAWRLGGLRSTPRQPSIAEEDGDRGKPGKASTAEMLARGIVQSESEKRRLKDKLTKLTVGTLAQSIRRLFSSASSRRPRHSHGIR